MVPTLLKQYAAYDLWANKRFVDRLLEESEEVLDRNVPSSFPSLRATMLHIRNAEHVWTAQLKNEKYAWPAEASTAIENLIHHSTILHDHVQGMNENDLIEQITYSDLRGNAHAQPAWELVMHCFNHSTQHRGQLITMMRALGMERIPANDLVVYQRQIKASF